MDQAGRLTLDAAQLEAWAKDAGFELVGFTPATPIPAEVLGDWLAAGHHADLDWMSAQAAERLDPSRLLPGAKTAIALACNYWHDDSPSPIARYARGRDYHATMRDRLRALRRRIRAEAPGVNDYGSVDALPVMEKVWAARAGLGYVAKNGCLVTERFGSWVVLAVMFLDVEVSAHAKGPQDDRCGSCQLCISACPTDAIVADGVIDARKCLSYQTIENEQPVPETVRAGLHGQVFGCDVCQEVCPLNHTPVLAHVRFTPRPVAGKSVLELAAMTAEEFQAWAPGTPLARAGYDGLRRNAAYALGAAREGSAVPVLERLAQDSSERVREAALWALARCRAE